MKHECPKCGCKFVEAILSEKLSSSLASVLKRADEYRLGDDLDPVEMHEICDALIQEHERANSRDRHEVCETDGCELLIPRRGPGTKT